tara:strand:+ start:3625 stop:4206 length:582 start_codon:yes stop_codon:yes gene_type:complete
MRRLIQKIGEWFREFRKDADALFDVFRPRGWVEIILIHRDTGSVHLHRRHRVWRPVLGRNVVTGFLGGPPYSGRDIMRRLIVPSAFTGNLSGDDYKIGKIELGSGTTAEASSDTELDTPLSPDSVKDVIDVEFDGTNPYVTFIAQWDESDANQEIAEALLWSNDGTHPYARKTFTPFTKNNDFTLQVRWTIRF